MDYTKRRWNPGEELDLGSYVINDTYVAQAGAVFRWSISTAYGIAAEGQEALDITADSCVELSRVKWKVPAEALPIDVAGG